MGKTEKTHDRRRAPERGLMLVEVLIVVAIIALVSGGIALAVIKMKGPTEDKTATNEARIIRQAVRLWQPQQSSGECPTVDRLINDELLERGTRTVDPWGQPYTVECIDEDATVVSAGRDRQLGTKDDIRVPPPRKRE
jgi:type II secretory pathway pseudopilin PulG